jgi:PAS domain S-box-containing protein
MECDVHLLTDILELLRKRSTAAAMNGTSPLTDLVDDEQLVSVLDSAIDHLIWIGSDGTILWANRSELDFLGYRYEQYVGHHVTEFHEDERRIAALLARLAGNERIVGFDARVRASDGSIKDVVLDSNFFFKSKNGAMVPGLCVSHDVTEPKQIEAALRTRNKILERERLQLEATLATLMTSAARERDAREEAEGSVTTLAALLRAAKLVVAVRLDLPRLAQVVVDEATALVKARYGVFFYNNVSDVGTSLIAYASSGASIEELPKLGLRHVPALFTSVFEKEGVIRCEAILADPRFTTSATTLRIADDPLPMASCLAVPIVSRDGNLLGAIAFGHPDAGRFTLRHEILLTNLASQTASAIDSAHLYEKTRIAEAASRSRASEATMGSKVATAFTRDGSLPQILQTCCLSVVDHLDAALARIWTVDAAGQMVVLQASAGQYTLLDDSHVRVPVGQFRIGKIASERRPYLTNDVQHDPWVSDHAWAVRTGIVSFAGYPLLVMDRLIGVLGVFSTHALSESTFGSLATLAATIALGIERHWYDLEREQLVNRLSDTLRMNELFAGVLAHDLRGPLGAITAGADIVRSLSDDPAIVKTMTRTLSSAERMARMIDELLDFTKLRLGGGFTIVPARTDLRDVCQTIVDEATTTALGWNIRLSFAGDTVGAWDRERLLQAFGNLVSNAIQHGDASSGVQIDVDGSQASWVTVAIANRGSIAAELVPMLFEPFRGSIHMRNAARRGLGLGLYITRQIVLTHGGSLEVTSVDEMTRALVKLPRTNAQREGPTTQSAG